MTKPKNAAEAVGQAVGALIVLGVGTVIIAGLVWLAATIIGSIA